ncbi:MAG: hypothetical protein JSU96_16685 [Acidobacteriota bacterium]|nr:MAG: hypothetical protein JSU96_16685 [Acidobacteriota bacterium]
MQLEEGEELEDIDLMESTESPGPRGKTAVLDQVKNLNYLDFTIGSQYGG